MEEVVRRLNSASIARFPARVTQRIVEIVFRCSIAARSLTRVNEKSASLSTSTPWLLSLQRTKARRRLRKGRGRSKKFPSRKEKRRVYRREEGRGWRTERMRNARSLHVLEQSSSRILRARWVTSTHFAISSRCTTIELFKIKQRRRGKYLQISASS